MKKEHLLIGVITFLTLSISVVVFAQLRNISRERTPKLTTDDVRSGTPPTVSSRNPVEPATGGISWQRDLSHALNLADAEGKVVVVDVYTDWCGWCKRMDEVIYADANVVGLSRQEIFLKLNAEDGGQGQQFAREMGVRGYPTTVVLDSRGRKLNLARGFIESPQKFIKFVENARAAN